MVRPTMLYGAQFCPDKHSHIKKIKMVKVMILRWMCGFTRRDRINNGYIRDMVTVTLMENKMRKSRLRWFGHVMRRCTYDLVRRCERLSRD
ncbi:hypothetical protein H5410_031851 [Solanum commersonii]|uniref:Uncharacterized protein n=1 Tax=Solanum commersonii TaxID=4109 RepID=A0A9J5YJG8_SOLCO|nr:hypothetical protein H5410_031851 [Solanum commersonii]